MTKYIICVKLNIKKFNNDEQQGYKSILNYSGLASLGPNIKYKCYSKIKSRKICQFVKTFGKMNKMLLLSGNLWNVPFVNKTIVF